MSIKNVVFDIGNVMVVYNTHQVVERLFPYHPDAQLLTQQIFKSQIWLDLNLGKLTEKEANIQYNKLLGIEIAQFELVMQEIKESQALVAGSLELLVKLHQANVKLYSLTDNIREIMVYLRNRYTFWDYFSGVVVSAEVNFLKPATEIYLHLLNSYNLQPQETVFIDDLPRNIDGAKVVGMYGIVFKDALSCELELKSLGVKF
jgi:putative hydrolase of the HAD superfamily